MTRSKHHRQHSVGFLLNLLTRRMDKLMKSRLAELGLNKKTFVNLRVLSDGDGIRQKELGRILEFPEYYTSRNVDALVASGYAERREDPTSRRAVRIHLTSKGKKTAAGLNDLVDEINTAFLDSLTKSEQANLCHLLRKLSNIPTEGDPGL